MEKKEREGKPNSGEISIAGRQRIAGLDILRCIAMMMVVVLHFLGKGELLGDVDAAEMGAVGMAAWVLEAFCIVAVNVYMLLSGYFLSDSSFKVSRLLALYLQIWCYSVGVGVAAALFGIIPAAEVDTHYFLSLLFPVSMGHYWFMTAYVFLCLLLPLIGIALKTMTKRQLNLVLTLLLLAFCVCKSFLLFRLEEDRFGYDCLWYLCVFLIAARIRRFGLRLLESRLRCACLYVGGCMGLLLEMLLIRQAYLRTGSMGLILKVSFEYNHIFPLAAAVGLFGLFLKIKAEGGFGRAVGRAAGKAAPYVLGVYLLHENLGLRYGWQRFFGADGIRTVPQLLLGTCAAVLCVFVTGVIIDWLRMCLMRGLHALLLHWGCYRKVTEAVERADEICKI